MILYEFRFEEAITYFCVACEYNLRLSKQCTLPMRAMDSCLLFKARRLCFEVMILFVFFFVLFQSFLLIELPRMPKIYFQVASQDAWGRHRTEGYTFIDIPSLPG